MRRQTEAQALAHRAKRIKTRICLSLGACRGVVDGSIRVVDAIDVRRSPEESELVFIWLPFGKEGGVPNRLLKRSVSGR